MKRRFAERASVETKTRYLPATRQKRYPLPGTRYPDKQVSRWFKSRSTHFLYS
jgi:hypothetical protein